MNWYKARYIACGSSRGRKRKAHLKCPRPAAPASVDIRLKVFPSIISLSTA
jgi:hypothetical protein